METYTPNRIPTGTRVANLLFSSVLIAYGGWGLYVDDLYVPGKRGPGIHFHGGPAWVLYAAFLCAAASMLSVVIDHYDTRNDERSYHVFSKVAVAAGWTLFLLALVWALTKGR